jgi:hypothetical protein
MQLVKVSLPSRVTKGMDVIRRMKSLTRINGQPADEFWKKHDAEQAKKYPGGRAERVRSPSVGA